MRLLLILIIAFVLGRFFLKKYFKYKITKVIVSSIGVLILIFLGWRIFFKEELKYEYGGWRSNDYSYFGNGRFKVGEFQDRMVLQDQKYLNDVEYNEFLMFDIEKYIQKDKHVYLIGYYTYHGLIKHIEFPDQPVSAINPETGEEMEFKSLYDTPRYSILNYSTGEIKLYKTLEEISEADRKIFEEELGWWCKFRRTCYEGEDGDNEG